MVRILLIEEDEARVRQLFASLSNFEISAAPVANLDEAVEAITMEKFQAILLGSPQSERPLADFASALRRVEAQGNSGIHAPIACFPPHPDTGLIELRLDGYDNLEPLLQLVNRLSLSGGMAADRVNPPEHLAVFEPAAFIEQCVGDHPLMGEIIDLFTGECANDLLEMAEALGRGDFERLARAAHTLKGSLASLHATFARSRASLLEIAAKEGDSVVCQQILEGLEADLQELQTRLHAFRDETLSA